MCFRLKFALWLVCMQTAFPVLANDCDKYEPGIAKHACESKKAEKVDANLNQRYALLKSLLKKDSLLRLKKAERAWIKFRDASCKLESTDIVAGSGWTGQSQSAHTELECIELMTKQRTKELNSYISVLQGNIDTGLYLSDEVELHAVGVKYGMRSSQAIGPAMCTTSSGEIIMQEGMVSVRVRQNKKPNILFLYSIQPIRWNIKQENNAMIKEIIIGGLGASKVEGVGDEVRVSRRVVPRVSDISMLVPIATKILKESTGLNVQTFQAKQYAHEFIIY